MTTPNTETSFLTCSPSFSPYGTSTSVRWVLKSIAMNLRVKILNQLTLHPTGQSQNAREFEKADTDKKHLQTVIEPAQTEWAAPTFFASKKKGSLRFCVGYQKLNAVIKRDSYLIPCMDECIGCIGEAMVLFTLDNISSYLQIKAETADHNKPHSHLIMMGCMSSYECPSD